MAGGLEAELRLMICQKGSANSNAVEVDSISLEYFSITFQGAPTPPLVVKFGRIEPNRRISNNKIKELKTKRLYTFTTRLRWIGRCNFRLGRRSGGPQPLVTNGPLQT